MNNKFITKNEIGKIKDIVERQESEEQEVIHGHLLEGASEPVLSALKALGGQSNLDALDKGFTALTSDCLDDLISYELEVGDPVQVSGLEIIRDALINVRMDDL